MGIRDRVMGGGCVGEAGGGEVKAKGKRQSAKGKRGEGVKG